MFCLPSLHPFGEGRIPTLALWGYQTHGIQHWTDEKDTPCYAKPNGGCTREQSEQPEFVRSRLCSIK